MHCPRRGRLRGGVGARWAMVCVDARRWRVHPPGMSTLTEIETAAATLPAEEQATLLRHLSRTLARRAEAATPWPVPPPAVPKEELQRIHALIEAEFSHVNGDDW